MSILQKVDTALNDFRQLDETHRIEQINQILTCMRKHKCDSLDYFGRTAYDKKLESMQNELACYCDSVKIDSSPVLDSPSDSVKSASPPPAAAPAEVIDLDSDATIVEVLETSTPPALASPSLLLDTPKPATPLKRALDQTDQDYAINTSKPQTPPMQIARPNIEYLQNFYDMYNQKELFEELLSYTYESITFNVHGRAFTPRRKVLAFADRGVSYSFSGTSLQPKPWTLLMQCIKDKVERQLNYQFNHALLNFYPDGEAKLSQHKDNENCVDTSVPIVTLSFGAQRDMQFTQKNKKPFTQPLHPGSALIMYKQYCSHGILADFSCKEPRISISFRKILVPDTVQPPAAAKPPTPKDIASQISSEAFLKFASLGPAQDMADPGFLESFPDAQPLLPEVESTEEPPTKKACLDIPENDWLTRHYQEVVQPTNTRLDHSTTLSNL